MHTPGADRFFTELRGCTAELARIIDGDLERPVPTCPGWTFRQLATHLGRGHRWAAQIVATRATAPIPQREVADGKLPEDPARHAHWLNAGAAQVIEAVTAAGSDLAWTFNGMRPRRPLMYGFAVEFIGPDTAKGREMISLWQYEGFRHIFRIITAVWGVGFLLEAALRVAIVYNTSTGTALSLSKVMPYIWVGIFVAWTVAYGRYQRKKGEQMMAAAAAVVEGPATSDADPQPADITKAAGQA